MSLDYQIDKCENVVFTICRNTLTPDDIKASRERYRTDPDFSPDMKQLIDLRSVTAVEVTTRDWRALAKTDPFGPGARRALVGDQDLTFGVLRMYEALSERPEVAVHVFRNIDEAREWLGIGAAPFDGPQP